MPDGTTIRVPTQGAETMLIAFIEDPSKKVDSGSKFSLDRVQYQPGAAQLSGASQEQLRNLAAILKAHPKVAIKITGYGDAGAEAAQNKKLSAERANAAMEELVKLGVNRSQLSAEGKDAPAPGRAPVEIVVTRK